MDEAGVNDSPSQLPMATGHKNQLSVELEDSPLSVEDQRPQLMWSPFNGKWQNKE